MGAWLYETEGAWPTETGLLDSKVTCHKNALQYMDDEDAWYWVGFLLEILVIPDGK